MDDLVTWLRAQLDEDERTARAAVDEGRWYSAHILTVNLGASAASAEHIARHDPARLLAEVDAKRRILDAYADAVRMHGLMEETDDDGKWDWLFRSEALEGVVQLLALPYADRPGYQQEWAP